MHAVVQRTLALVAALLAGQAAAQVTLYEHENFQGRSFSSGDAVDDFSRRGFNDRASSLVVERSAWEVCQDAGYGGRCVLLQPGRYPSLAAMGLNDRVSSMRSVGPAADGRAAARGDRDDRSDDRYDRDDRSRPAQDYRRRGNERLFEANVIEARAVLATPEQRCWVERGQVAAPPPARRDANVPGAIAGALIGGILGHQVGGGFGKDVATLGGVAAGAAVGAQVGRDRDGQPVATQDVRRCADLPGGARTAYWDVSYRFRGVTHRLQMTRDPGPTITVNRAGEPRV